MTINLNPKDLEKIIIVNDRVLIKPKSVQKKTNSGLYLPPGVTEKEKLHTGYIVKTGPGYPIPAVTEEDEAWKNKQEQVKYVPLQAQVGDLAVYLNKSGYELEFNKEKYIILPHASIMMLVRDEGLLET